MIDLGLQIEPQFGYDYAEIIAISQKAAETGIHNIWFSDHFFLDKESVDKVSYDIWTVMTAVAVQLKQIRVGSLVLCNNYRHPSVVAKMVASLDQISGGRFDFGIGAGWKEIEYYAYGIPYPSASTRIEQLDESIQIMKLLWNKEKVSFTGKHYQIQDAISHPKPLQQPHPELWIGTMKAKPKMLRLIAKHADGANIAWSYTPKQVGDLFSKIDDFAKKEDRKLPVKRSLGLWAGIYPTEDKFNDFMKGQAQKRGMDEERYRKRMEGTLHGPPEFWLKRLEEYKRVGVEKLIFMFPYRKELGQLSLLKKTVLDN